MQTCDLAECVTGYAARLHAAIGTGHQVASPLGAWLLLALAGPASAGADRVTLTEVIGCDVDAAGSAAAALLADPHPLVASAAALWTAPWAPLGPAFRSWQAALPPAVTTGQLPDQAGLDSWAREHTFGLIERFPVSWSPSLYLVLASALATKVSWQVPFRLTPATDLGPDSPWARQLSRVLRSPDPLPPGHRPFIAVSPDAGDVAVHVAAAQQGLLVYSVAAGRSVPASQVLSAAHQIACADAIGAPLQRRSLAELPLGAGPAWLLREEESAHPGQDICTAVLPAWSARSEHDLSAPGLGFSAARNALVPGPDPWEARQAAMARYSRTGFEAAAVTGFAVSLAAMLPQGTRRAAELRFGHPYAVVAVAIDGNGDAPATPAGQSGWHGVPVFSAWVAAPENAADDDVR